MEWLTIIGLSSIISILLSGIIEFIRSRTSFRYEKLHMEKEARYRSMLVFMSVIVDPNNLQHIETSNKPNDEKVTEYYMREIRLQKSFCYLFASDEVIKQLDKFIQDPNKDRFELVAKSMRRDLWKRKK